MTAADARRQPISLTRIRAVAEVRVRRVYRTRIALVALLLALLPWLLVESPALLPRLASLAEFSLVGLTVIAAGAIGDDLDSGEYAVVLSHDTSAIEFLAGQGGASLALGMALVAIGLPIALTGTTIPRVVPLLLCVAWLLALLIAWLALALLLGTFLEGKANAVAMGALLAIVPLLAGPGLLERFPAAVETAVRAALQVIPQVSHVSPMFRALLDDTPAGMLQPTLLLLSPILYFLLAALRLLRLEPAGRLTQ